MVSVIADKDFFMYNVNKMLNELPDDLDTLNSTQLQEFLDESTKLQEELQQFLNLQNFDDLNNMFLDMQNNLQLSIDNNILKHKKTDFLLREEKMFDKKDIIDVEKDDVMEDNVPGLAGSLMSSFNKGMNKFI